MFGSELRKFFAKTEHHQSLPLRQESSDERRLSAEIEMAANGIVQELKANGITKKEFFARKNQEQSSQTGKTAGTFGLLPTILRHIDGFKFDGLTSAELAKRLQEAVERKLDKLG